MAMTVVGAGGHAKVVLDAVQCAQLSQGLIVLDEGTSTKITLLGHPICYGYEKNQSILPTMLHVAIGDNQLRLKLCDQFEADGFNLTTIIHPLASISQHAILGAGAFIASQSILAPSVIIGRACIINHAAIVDHDTEIGEGTHIAPHVTLGGNVKIGRLCMIGAGAIILPGLSIADDTVVGAGAVVTKDITSPGVYIGIPAKLSSFVAKK